jgi:hypothetical protein
LIQTKFVLYHLNYWTRGYGGMVDTLDLESSE